MPNKCPMCGAPMTSEKCRYCGYLAELPAPPPPPPAPKPAPTPKPPPAPPCSRKSRLVALVLCVLLGEFGAHRFYVGKIGTGLLYLFTWGGFGLGWAIDALRLLFGRFYDKRDLRVKKWLG